MTQKGTIDQRGVYNVEYFSGAQAAVYIGDVWVDEITGIQYGVQQSRTPLYGYADTYWRDVSEGQVIVQGSFSINFKEAGYLFLVLDRYREKVKGKVSSMDRTPFLASDFAMQQNIERAYNGEISRADKIKLLQNLAAFDNKFRRGNAYSIQYEQGASASASLRGFASEQRAAGGIGAAEDAFEVFEDAAWGKSQTELDEDTRRADDPKLNPFDIYVSFGDFAGDNSANHTIQKLSNVTILSASKSVAPNGQPIQEVYTFIARNLV